MTSLTCRRNSRRPNGRVDQQLLLDLHQQIVVRQLQRHRNRLVEFAQLFDDLFHLHLLS